MSGQDWPKFHLSLYPLPGGERSDRSWRCESIVQRDPGEGALLHRETVTPHPNPLPKGEGARRLVALVEPNSVTPYRSESPVAASSSAIACAALTTLIVVMPISRAGLRLTPRSSR